MALTKHALNSKRIAAILVLESLSVLFANNFTESSRNNQFVQTKAKSKDQHRYKLKLDFPSELQIENENNFRNITAHKKILDRRKNLQSVNNLIKMSCLQSILNIRLDSEHTYQSIQSIFDQKTIEELKASDCLHNGTLDTQDISANFNIWVPDRTLRNNLETKLKNVIAANIERIALANISSRSELLNSEDANGNEYENLTTAENFSTRETSDSETISELAETSELDRAHREFLSYIKRDEDYQPIHTLEKYYEMMLDEPVTTRYHFDLFGSLDKTRQEFRRLDNFSRNFKNKLDVMKSLIETAEEVVSRHQGTSFWDRVRSFGTYVAKDNDPYRTLPVCPEIPPTLEGHLSLSVPRLEDVGMTGLLKNLSWVQPGGTWSPIYDTDAPCIARHRVAVIVPYRDRVQHLAIMLSWLHPILRRQQLHYTVYVAEQVGNVTFNKGAIMNAGFVEVYTNTDADCFVFHDVDLLMEDDRNMYSCPSRPRHLSVGVDTLQYKLPYFLLVGGVMAVTGEQFLKLNGYSNMYWGWGGEDDDMGYRMMKSGLGISRPPFHIARYSMIRHTKRKPLIWKVRSKLVRTSSKRYRVDGLNTLVSAPAKRSLHPLYTHLLFDVGAPPQDIVNFALQ